MQTPEALSNFSDDILSLDAMDLLESRTHFVPVTQQEGEESMSLVNFDGPSEPIQESKLPDCSHCNAPIIGSDVMTLDAKECDRSLPAATVEVQESEGNSSNASHAYANVGVISPGTYSRLLLRSTPRPKGRKLQSRGCRAVHSTEGGEEDSNNDSAAAKRSMKRSRQM